MSSSASASSSSSNQEARVLPEDFQPGENQVIIGRGKRCLEHEGNKRLRNIVKAELKTYVNAGSKVEKSMILLRVMRQVRSSNEDEVGFVKQDLNTGRWLELTEFASRVSVAQAFRDALSNRYKSSKQSKQNKRRVERLKTAASSSTVVDQITVANAFQASFGSPTNMGTQRNINLGRFGTAVLNIPPAVTVRDTLSNALDMVNQAEPIMMSPQGASSMNQLMQEQQAMMMQQQQYMMMQQAQFQNGGGMMAAMMQQQQQQQIPQPSMMGAPTQQWCPPHPRMVTPRQSMVGEFAPSHSNSMATAVNVGSYHHHQESSFDPLPVGDQDASESSEEPTEGEDFVEIFNSTSLPNLEAALAP